MANNSQVSVTDYLFALSLCIDLHGLAEGSIGGAAQKVGGPLAADGAIGKQFTDQGAVGGAYPLRRHLAQREMSNRAGRRCSCADDIATGTVQSNLGGSGKSN